MLALRLPTEIESRLSNLAALTGRSKSFYAREAITEHISDLEELYLAEKVYADHLAGKIKSYTLEEVEARLGLAD